MEIEGHCNACHRTFDAHWHQYPDLTTQEAILDPYCTYCKSHDVFTTTDESGDDFSYETDETDPVEED